MLSIAKEDFVTVHAATTGLTSRGSDLGGFNLKRAVALPKLFSLSRV
jgi:hypothetical protein